MQSLGELQKRIIEISETKRLIKISDITRIYGDSRKAISAMESLTVRGYFDKGTNKATGEIVYVSRQFIPTLENISQIKHPLHPELFECPERENKDFNLTTLEACKSSFLGNGCKYLKTCKTYLERKN